MRARTRVSLWAAGVAVFLLWSWAMMVAWSGTVAAFLVLGTVTDTAGEPQDGWTVTVANGERWEIETVTGEDGDPGLYQVFQLDFGTNNAAGTDDVITVTFEGPDGESYAETHTLTDDHITAASLEVNYEAPSGPAGPGIDSLDPLTVTQLGGEAITVTGSGLTAGAVLLVGDIEVTLDVVGATTATATLPELPVGAASVLVRNTDGQEGTFAGVLTVEAALIGDIPPRDGVVDIRDLVTVAASFGQSGDDLVGDLNGDGTVNIIDLVMLAREFGASVLTAAPALAAAGDARVVASAHTVVGSDAFTLDLFVTDVSTGMGSLGGYDLELAFDPTRLRLVGVAEGDMFDGSGVVFRQTHTDAEAAAGKARLLAVPLTDMETSESGEIGTLRFDVLGSWDEALHSLRIVRADLADRSAQRILATLTPLVHDMRLTADGQTMSGQNYPNPFNPETWIPYQLAEDADVAVRIYEAGGSLVRTLDLGRQPAGGHVGRTGAAYWDGANEVGEQVAGGVYFYEFRAGSTSQTRRMVILK
jgi:hypothetical protein